MTIMIMEGEGQLNRGELTFFLKGDMALEAASKPCPFDWMQAQGWRDLLLLASQAPVFESIVSDVERNSDLWKAWFDLETPEVCTVTSMCTLRVAARVVCLCECEVYLPREVFLPDHAAVHVRPGIVGVTSRLRICPWGTKTSCRRSSG